MLVSLGGDIAVAGEPPVGGWVVRVCDDHQAPDVGPVEDVSIESGGLATSSTTVRHWSRGDEDLHHVVDPDTGRPATVVWRTATVAAASCLDANIASTASLILGRDAPAWLVEQGLAARLVRVDGTRRRRRRVARAVILAASTGSALWYLARGTGLVSIVLLTVVMVLGVTEVQRWAREGWPRLVIAGLHKNVSLLVVAFLGVHIASSVLDSFVPISLLDAFVPFTSPYRPIWLGLGALSFDLLLALVITSLLRGRIGHRTWRTIHWAAYASWPIAFVHGLGTGSDGRVGWVVAARPGLPGRRPRCHRLAARRRVGGRAGPEGRRRGGQRDRRGRGAGMAGHRSLPARMGSQGRHPDRRNLDRRRCRRRRRGPSGDAAATRAAARRPRPADLTPPFTADFVRHGQPGRRRLDLDDHHRRHAERRGRRARSQVVLERHARLERRGADDVEHGDADRRQPHR